MYAMPTFVKHPSSSKTKQNRVFIEGNYTVCQGVKLPCLPAKCSYICTLE